MDTLRVQTCALRPKQVRLPFGAWFYYKANENDPMNKHHLCKLEKDYCQWNGQEFPRSEEGGYPKSCCGGKGCKNQINSFCLCSFDHMLCPTCQ